MAMWHIAQPIGTLTHLLIIINANIAATKSSPGGQYRLKGGHLYSRGIKMICLFLRKNEKVYLCFHNGIFLRH